MRLETLAPAKVNLVLRVGPPRPDGFHGIRSLMVPLDLGDRVDVSVERARGPGHLPRARPARARRPGEPRRSRGGAVPRALRRGPRRRDPDREADPRDRRARRRLVRRGRRAPLPRARVPDPRRGRARRDRARGRLGRAVLPRARAGLGGGPRRDGSRRPTCRPCTSCSSTRPTRRSRSAPATRTAGSTRRDTGGGRALLAPVRALRAVPRGERPRAALPRRAAPPSQTLLGLPCRCEERRPL